MGRFQSAQPGFLAHGQGCAKRQEQLEWVEDDGLRQQ